MKTKTFALASATLASLFAFGLPAQAQEASQSIPDLVAFCGA